MLKTYQQNLELSCCAMPNQCIQYTGTAGGEAQQIDIKMLRKELELKKSKLNEMREEARRQVFYANRTAIEKVKMHFLMLVVQA